MKTEITTNDMDRVGRIVRFCLGVRDHLADMEGWAKTCGLTGEENAIGCRSLALATKRKLENPPPRNEEEADAHKREFEELLSHFIEREMLPPAAAIAYKSGVRRGSLRELEEKGKATFDSTTGNYVIEVDEDDEDLDESEELDELEESEDPEE